jgi:hypothetical protein
MAGPLARWLNPRYHQAIMEPLDIALLVAAVLLAILSRAVMKRFVSRRLGKSSDALLEIDFWRAASGDGLTRGLLFVELLSWAATVLLIVMLASRVLRLQ